VSLLLFFLDGFVVVVVVAAVAVVAAADADAVVVTVVLLVCYYCCVVCSCFCRLLLPLPLFEVHGWLEEKFEEGNTEETVSIAEIEDYVKQKPEVKRVRVLLPQHHLITAVASCFPGAQCVGDGRTGVLYPCHR